MNVDEILEAFVKKYPTYKKYRAKIYQKTCQLKGVPEENKESFFSFLEKSGINFYYKKPRRLPEKKERKILDISHFLKNIDR